MRQLIERKCGQFHFISEAQNNTNVLFFKVCHPVKVQLSTDL